MKKIRHLILFFILILISFSFSSDIPNLNSKIPFELVDHVIIIQAKVNGSKKLNFIFDTGNGVTIINTETADEMGLRHNKEVEIMGAGSKRFIPIIEDCSLELPNVRIDSIELIKIPLTKYELLLGMEIDGILGYAFLKDYIVRVDYDAQTIDIIDKITAENSYSKSYDIIMSFNAPVLVASVKFKNGKVLKGNFMLDSGFNGTVAISAPYHEGQDVTSLIGKHFYARSYGTLGKNHAFVGRAESFEMGDFKFENVPISLSKAEGGILATDRYVGLIGNEILRRFNVAYDYNNLKIYLEPNNTFNNDFNVSGSGVSVRMNVLNKKILINNVYDNTPGAKAGLKRDDEIIEINGLDVKEYSFMEVKKLLRENGKTIEIAIRRDAKVQEFVIKLEEII